ncbi:hypothetical protein RhiirA1_478811, partial [Rhizophagus irregularis]
MLYLSQALSHFTNLFLLANSSSPFMKSLFNYRLRFIQFYCLIPISPLMVLDWTCWSSLLIFKQDYIANTLASLISTPFHLSRANLSPVPDLTYPNGHTPIYQCLSLDVFMANLARLHKRGLFYLSQLLTPQGTHLLSWSVIYANSIQKRGNARIPNWYKDLSANVTIPDRFMTDQRPVSQFAKELVPCTPPSGYKKNWIATMNDDGLPYS